MVLLSGQQDGGNRQAGLAIIHLLGGFIMVAPIFPQGIGHAFSGQKILSGFAGTSSLITSACASAAGWDSAVHDPATAAGPCVLSYVWDQPSGWVWVCSTSPKQFAAQAGKASNAKPKVIGGIRLALGDLIFHAASGAPVDLGLGATWENALGSMLAAYAGTTQAFELADGFPAGGHFIVLFYRGAGQRDGLLRPFALPGSLSSREVLPVDELLGVIRQVVQMDRVHHPGWFG